MLKPNYQKKVKLVQICEMLEETQADGAKLAEFHICGFDKLLQHYQYAFITV
jgi:hypothetical protein